MAGIARGVSVYPEAFLCTEPSDSVWLTERWQCGLRGSIFVVVEHFGRAWMLAV
ncbi:hypothetical protein ACFWHR_09315 [Leucobacter sp. NPDC058333]|uniref:hypothetical protein n=1 Tax=Leucobacter sp. NPDC058333 TaxID=3346450 RepID=UPI003659E43C